MPDPTLVCAMCSSNMGPHNVGGQPVWLCDQCGSFSMKSGTFEGFVGVDATAHTHKKEGGVVHNCPGCRGGMKGTDVMGVEMDYCSSCDIVHAGRGSLSLVMDSSEEPEQLGEVLLQMDVDRNVDNALKGGAMTIPGGSVDDVFVLFKNGILITSYATDVREGMDKDILASMMMAITDFVQSCFKSVGKRKTLSSIKFEDREIAFEHGKLIVVALTLKGTLDDRTRKMIASKLGEIERRNEKVLVGWNGNLGLLGVVIKDLDGMVGALKA